MLPRIAIIAYAYGTIGGSERFVQEVTERLAATGKYEIHVFTAQWSSKCTSITFHKVPVFTFSVFLRVWGFKHLVGRMIAKGKFDVVHSHWGTAHANVYSLHGTPHAFWVRTVLQRRFPKFASRVMFAMDRDMMALGDNKIFMPVSSHLQSIYVSEYGKLPGTWNVVHPGIDQSAFERLDRNKARCEIRKKYSISDNALVILFVGMNFKTKGLETVIRAAGQVRRIRPNSPVHVLVVGRGNKNKYRKIAFASGCADAVTFTGAQFESIERFYASADVFALPAQFETFCMVVLEAMATGLPVIISENMGVKDIVRHGTNGFVLPNGDQITSLTECLIQLLDPKLRQMIGEAAYATSKNHSWDRVAKAVEDIYDQQLNAIKSIGM